jgi:hypothetical protein
MFKQHDLMVLCRDAPEHGLKQGDIGVIVACYDNRGYEVEFTGAEGNTLAVLTLESKDIRPLARDEILHARQIERAAS